MWHCSSLPRLFMVSYYRRLSVAFSQLHGRDVGPVFVSDFANQSRMLAPTQQEMLLQIERRKTAKKTVKSERPAKRKAGY